LRFYPLKDGQILFNQRVTRFVRSTFYLVDLEGGLLRLLLNEPLNS